MEWLINHNPWESSEATEHGTQPRVSSEHHGPCPPERRRRRQPRKNLVRLYDSGSTASQGGPDLQSPGTGSTSSQGGPDISGDD